MNSWTRPPSRQEQAPDELSTCSPRVEQELLEAAPAGIAPNDPYAEQYLDRCTACLERPLEPTRSDLLSLEQAVSDRWSEQQLGELHRRLARRLLARLAAGRRLEGLPDGFHADVEAELARIRAEIQHKPVSHFTFANYRFKADLRILSLRRIPAGMYDLEVSAIPKRLLLEQGASGSLRLLRVIAKAGGFAPYFTQHVSPHRLELFSPSERERFLRRIGSLLRSRREILGLTSTAWYNDPAVAGISPHLAYLREGWERWGHGVYRIGTSDDVTQGAIARSAKRRLLVEEGSYVPTAYLGVALREQLLAIASSGVGDGRERA